MARHALSEVWSQPDALCGRFSVIGTFAVNAAGSLLIGAVTGYARRNRRSFRCSRGGLLRRIHYVFHLFGRHGAAAARWGIRHRGVYVALSLVVCTACTALGLWTGQNFEKFNKIERLWSF